jgi:hypothetical protein
MRRSACGWLAVAGHGAKLEFAALSTLGGGGGGAGVTVETVVTVAAYS